ncbi:putative 1-phosphatidylinositol 3-phosphate 5-kinase isoform X2 [Toxorhynchites rutilus septentrionalis]|uniref:putative 1-phosphatidylinositol 3-phosphate 5-kinase isoform X2 n=1 Tax=Toxorhynchites rutilus septentrionalis TaxID=329112 RepID=UPI00247AC367|nr:putative 1-phosphatidylinositol 3-phosphate 5-kinase isoform X2 [Toxorhynchites rutilus septentrionalis]
MNKNLHSPTTLTEFARDFEKDSETIFSKIVNKLTTGIYQSGFSEIASRDGEEDVRYAEGEKNVVECDVGTSVEVVAKNKSDDTLESPGQPSDTVTSERSPSLNVLKRLSILAPQRSSHYQDYRNTDLQKLWMPDSTSIECYECSVKFTTFRRKHHCRLCGQIFCTKCCNQVVPGKIINCSGDLKVCTYCSKVVLTYLKSSDIAADLKFDLKSLQEDLSNKLSTGVVAVQVDGDSSMANVQRRKISVGYQEERFVTNRTTAISNADRKAILQQSNSLRALYDEMIQFMPILNRGSKLIEFLISSQKSSNNRQAIAILSAMIDAGFLIPSMNVYLRANASNVDDEEVNQMVEFDESMVYKFLCLDGNVSHTGSYGLELEPESNVVHLTRSSENADKCYTDVNPLSASGSTQFRSSRNEVELENSLLFSSGAKALLEAFCEHEEILLHQLLRNENLDQSWAKTLISLAARVANTVQPSACGLMDAMDIRNYVYFKKVPGGKRHESQIIGGIAFSKNIVHKQMMSRVEKPRILLLRCPIAYQRVEGKFVSFDTLMLQEKDYLKNKVAKILSLGANIVLVHKNVAGIAQDMLRDNGITLVLDVKLCVIERIARCLECDILSSVDSNVGQPKLGTCDTFSIRTFFDEQDSLKTLMCFEKSCSPRGCCVLLRGGNKSELVKIKKVMSLLVFARYNWRLELAYLCDEYARPPSPRPSIFESKETSPSDESNNNNNERNTSSATMARKTEESDKRININKENVGDYSDPLRATTISPSVFSPESSFELTVETPFDNSFRAALSSTILSISPFLSFPLPYLETECGQKCALRCYFPKNLYFSKQWSEHVHDKHAGLDSTAADWNETSKLLSPHEFTSYRITSAIDNKEMQTVLANYRASGGRYPKHSEMKRIAINRRGIPSLLRKSTEESPHKDVLDIENHQRLPVLFSSFYYNPTAPSSFCAEPSFLNMQFYGQNDIMLGEFLERYCFRSPYICKSCNLPMLDHVRRYVHAQGCVHVKLLEDANKVDTGTILITSKCTICNAVTNPAPMSHDTWCYSFAKYLELRFHGHSYKRRAIDGQVNCSHSLHRDCIQYFSYMGIIASFMYSPVEIWKISLPAIIVQLKLMNKFDTQQMTEEVKTFAVKGYEIYAKIFEKLAELSDDTDTFARLKKKANQDQMNFKQRVEAVQTLLTETQICAENVEDAMLLLKKALVETVENWEPKLQEIVFHSKSTPAKSEVQDVDSGTVVTEDLDVVNEGFPSSNKYISTAKSIDDFDDALPSEAVTESTTIEEKNVRENDRKSVMSIISQLLYSSENTNILNLPLPTNEHHNLRSGIFPVMVDDNDLASCIAYSLVSGDYKTSLDNLYVGNPIENSPRMKRKSLEAGSTVEADDSLLNKTESVESKKGKPSHIEIHFQDSMSNFTCKVYFAKEFDNLRCNLLETPGNITENKHQKPRKSTNITEDNANSVRRMFARSLCRSIQWEARGGKSGSKFSKTLDDRFVLKEMSRTDISIFENFAPNYFEYLHECLQKNQPTLLAKIFGVFKVTVRRKEWHEHYFDQYSGDRDISSSQPNLLGLDLAEHLKSHFSLYNQSDPSLSHTSRKTEYAVCFHPHEYNLRLPLTRRHTTLQIESGTMSKKTEHNSNFIAYTKETMAKSRPELVKQKEAIETFNESLSSPKYSEYRSSFIPYKLIGFSDHTGELVQSNGTRNGEKERERISSDLSLHNKKKFERTNIKLNGNIMLEPEYKNKYIEFPIEKSQSTPQLNNINFSANIKGMPSEYMECYKSYDHFIKSAPIKKVDNLSLSGLVDLVPEYKDHFRCPSQNTVDRSSYAKREDNLLLDGEFSKLLPEYNSSYRNPAITQKPEIAKPKAGILKLEGNMSYEPIYRCSFIDFPRSRPVISKPISNMKFETQDSAEERSNKKNNGQQKLRSRIPVLNQHKPATDEELAQFASLPEYRKAKRELLIKTKPLQSSKSFLAQTIHDGKNKIGLRQDGNSVSTKITGNDQEDYSSKANSYHYISGNERNTKEKKKFDSNVQKSSILAIKMENDKALHNISQLRGGKKTFRNNQSNIIEANKHYAENTSDQYRKYHLSRRKTESRNTVPQSFVVLNAPIKQRNKRWFAPTTIYDSHMY